ncbi:sugar (glycoside-pentoside-hexuronide) transporter [Pseudoduganella lurida]|uniref:Sugar (Glycoside-pentoside-hexuronide) transporter n=1 Tax=Pseudoduganella lurida TaxID=1036180 RepID=A0A562RG66_9BURK|nr:MFS transporter [Pseudoduganella lurida]TWI67420.1 sugar (glycoside-pentoside-hexuronide) transporter [Pseudoduganella lurida]
MTFTASSAPARLGVPEKLGYCLGDLAANLIFQTLLTFIAFFYTDVFNIPANAAATIIFAGGIVGACFNPLMGLIADRTSTRWGKFRPWLLWTSIPFGLIAILAFSTPDLGNDGKIIYASLTYVLLMLVYSANNLPYSALSGVMTGSMSDRNSLQSYRFVAVMVAQFIIQVLLLPLVLILGGGDKVAGFRNTMIIFAIAGTLCFLITFMTTRERIVPSAAQRSSIGQDIADLLKNRPWVVMLCVTVLVFITLALKGGLYIYYFRSYLDPAQLAAFLRGIGFNDFIAGLNGLLAGLGLTAFQWPEDAATSAFSLFNAIGILMMVVGIGFSRPLADHFGKRVVFGGALFVSTLFLLAFYFYAPGSIGIVFISQLLHGFFYGITIPLLWAMIADVADYSEWKNHRRATALLFSAMIFGLKAGLAIGGALVAALLSSFGYDPHGATQAPAVVDGIRLAISLYAGLPFLLAVASLAFYDIGKAVEHTLERDLGARRLAAQQ